MPYVILDHSNRCHVVHKGFACKPEELNRELAIHCRLKPSDIQRVHIYDSAEAAETIAETVNNAVDKHDAVSI